MTIAYNSRNFGGNAKTALKDETLRAAMKKATDLFSDHRRAAVDAMPEWEELRERARAIKEDTLFHLDRYLEQFVENAERAGVKIHWARDAKEACEIVARVVRDVGAHRLVKAKSMTTEEIGLNRALEEDGCDPIETDLGEWIIQLAGEMPSHIIAPAIHKTKEQVSDLFVDKLGVAPTDDINEMAATARRVLRRHFAQADLGVSGVNFGIAETGSILLVENEGNIRLTTSLPRVHIAVMGIEKLLPRFRDLEVFLRLLARSGTGQKLTSYQSLITGPNRGGEGPDEVHVLLLDNGRSAMLRRRVTRQSLACIRCGACLNVCPVYKEIGGHAYGSVYSGPIGAVITPQLAGLEPAAQLPFASSLCGACRDVCPVKIDLPELLLALRAEVSGGGNGRPPRGSPPVGSRGERRAFRAWSWIMSSPMRYRLAAKLARIFPNVWHKRAGAWTEARDLRPLAPKSFREEWRKRRKA
ncbi:MAG: LutB/LldF family L-lactate oxidation iron-sulfur protein [Planctomycetota bacterium]|nr:LutB/LldF family L-lactate oxidation iron-sulfur protein [Planctomycetota bacterium]